MAMHAVADMAATDPTRFDVLDLLLQYDGNINEMELDSEGRQARRQRTRFKGTPLHHALQDIGLPSSNHIKIVKYLLERGADPTALS
jgi:hypothetical protein